MRTTNAVLALLSVLSMLASFTSARPWTSGDECPTELNVLISQDWCSQHGEYCTDEPELKTMDAVHAALSSCPNFTSLDLHVDSGGCTGQQWRSNLPFNPAGGDHYPRMKKLRLEGYDFGVEMSGHWRKIPQEQQGKSNFAHWLDAMDWSRIEELYIDRLTPEILHRLPSNLQSLQKLETTNLPFILALPNNTLTDLVWIGPSQSHDLLAILAHQGRSLQSLEFRCPELWCPSFTPAFDVSILSNKAQNLAHVSINVPRNGTWPLETLQAIALMPKLRTADLYMNIQSPCSQEYDAYPLGYRQYKRDHGKEYCQGEDRFQTPLLNGTSALELFEYMRENKAGEDLEEVNFFIGDWARPWDGPLYFPPWVEGRQAKVVCKSKGQEPPESGCVVQTGERYWEHKYPWSGEL